MAHRRRPWPLAVDRLVAAGFVVAGVVEAVVRYHDRPVQLAIAAPGALIWGFLALRRRRPLLVVAAVAGVGAFGSLLQAWLVPSETTNSDVAIIALMVAGYSLGAYGSRRELLLGAPLPILAILLTDLLQPADEPLAKAVPFAVAFVVAGPVAAGRLVRARALAIERLQAQAAELDAHRTEQIAAEVARDRLRLSERFHIRLLDGMAVLVDEVERAQRLSGSGEPGDADAGETAVAAIERTARELLVQTRQVVVSMTDPPAPIPDARHPLSDTASSASPGGTSASDDADPESVDGDPVVADQTSAWWLRCTRAQPWTALAASAIGAGLIVELHALPLHAPMPLAVLACAVLVAPLGVLWLSPLPMTILLWVFALLFAAFVASLTSSTAAIGLIVATPFAIAALAEKPLAVAGFAVCAGGGFLIYGRDNVVAALVISALSWLAGAVLRERSRLVDDLRFGAALLAEQRAAVHQRAILQERARLARDLHDTFGHSLTVVALQAGAARRLWRSDRARALEVVETVAAVTASGLAELRAGGEPVEGARAGLPLDELIAGVRAAGVPIAMDLGDTLCRLDQRGSEVLYRAVQESLTNVLRHAPGASVTIAAREAYGFVELTLDNGPGGADSGAGSGRGLIGMQARVTACGGLLDWRRRADGGFTVCVRLPAGAPKVRAGRSATPADSETGGAGGGRTAAGAQLRSGAVA